MKVIKILKKIFGIPENPIILSDREMEIVNELKRDGALEYFIKTPEEDLIQFHHSLGQWIRNKWLWKPWEDGDKHPDDESYEMIVSLHKKFNG